MSERRRALEQRAEKTVRRFLGDPDLRAAARRHGFSDARLDRLADSAARQLREETRLYELGRELEAKQSR